ncbi:MAG: glycine cleavage system protein H [Chloroflexota bacterium]
MKRILYILIAFTLLSRSVSAMNVAREMPGPDSLLLLSTPELKNLVTKWSDGYKTAAPGKLISVKQVSSIPAVHSGKQGQIGFLQDKDIRSMSDAWGTRIVVARNVVVPVVNASNPFLEDLRSKGITPGKIKLLIEDQPAWGDILSGAQDRPVKFHYLNDPLVLSAMTEFTSSDRNKMGGTQHSAADQLLSSLSADIYSVGFCRLEDIKEGNLLSGKIAILPIDRNGNGTMDSNEDIYSDLTAFTRGVWIGKYPKALYANIYSVTSSPFNEDVKDFLNWLITDGQNVLQSESYTGLILTERISVAGRIAEAAVPVANSLSQPNIFKTLLIVLVLLASGILVIHFVLNSLKRKPVENVAGSEGSVLDEKSILLPKGVYFDKTHTWAFMEQDGIVKVGVDDFLLHMTGQVNRLKLKKPGSKVKRGEEILSVLHNGKQLNLYSPVSGIIRENNAELESNVFLLNSSPYSNGWVYRVEPENWQRENQLLFMADKHREFVTNEIARIKDFLAGLFRDENMQYAPVVLQDGGMLRDGVLSEMEPEVWEEFQSKIIDPSRTVWFYEII